MADDQVITLKRIADIAHAGGLVMLTEAEALVAIRRLTLPYWNKKRLTDPMQSDVSAAVRASKQNPSTTKEIPDERRHFNP